jgi:hypothetical protein
MTWQANTVTIRFNAYVTWSDESPSTPATDEIERWTLRHES